MSRRSSLPAHIAAGLNLAPREQVDHHLVLESGEHLALTPRALYLAADEGPEVRVARFEYAQVVSARLDPAAKQLTIEFVPDIPSAIMPVPDAADAFTRALYERVTASVVTSEAIKVPGGTVRVAIRRGEDGALFSQVLPERGVDLSQPEIAAQIADLEGRLREACGLGPKMC